MRIDSIDSNYSQLASMKRINRASDDAAGLSIVEKLNAQVSGTDMGTRNTEDMNSLLNTAEGALSSVQDGLHRMRELAVQASNGILSDSDRSAIQSEIEQIKSSIGESVKNTEFNTIKLLDGSFSDKNTAMNASGRGTTMTIEDTSLESLGIADFDVRGDFDISTIDSALETVSSSRSDLGASSNMFEHAINYNNIASENQSDASSRIADLDVGKAIMDLRRDQALQQYQFHMQGLSMQNALGSISTLL